MSNIVLILAYNITFSVSSDVFVTFVDASSEHRQARSEQLRPPGSSVPGTLKNLLGTFEFCLEHIMRCGQRCVRR